jgi:hypothetical protein
MEPQHTPTNPVPLRSDFCRVFDERYFCFVPKQVEKSVSGGVGNRDPQTQTQTQTQTRPPIHVFVPSPNGQVAGLWHNRSLHPLPLGLSTECLFARFAYTILSLAVLFPAFLSGTTVQALQRIETWVWAGECYIQRPARTQQSVKDKRLDEAVV